MKLNKKSCDLQSCVMCRLCQKEWLPAINANRKTYQYAKGEKVFEEDEEVKGMFFITSGLVKVHKHWGEEKELILRIASNGDILGHRGLGSDTIYPASATALTSTDICFVDLEFFTSTLKVNTGFLYQLMMFFAGELKESEKRMRNLAHMPAKGRIANALISLQNKFGTSPSGAINVILSRQDFASYTGTTYETFFRLLNELSEEGAITTENKEIKIKDLEKLLVYMVVG
ncbi:Crp/Fnr family transcriptional regulator [Pollutibacter soli]|uniref:Crp/Fnr family transcriptional regulator n=1 Tax=Pollutibacter soli TaxID=3034157 RepID=UPI00301407C9